MAEENRLDWQAWRQVWLQPLALTVYATWVALLVGAGVCLYAAL